MEYNGNRSFVDVSAANTQKTHTISLPNGKEIHIHTLTVSTQGADIGADCEVDVKDNGVEVWSMTLRLGQLFGGHFDFSSCPIPIRAGDLTVVTGAAGAGVIVKCALTYEIR